MENTVNIAHRDTLRDEEWEAVEALLPLIHKQKEWEVSSFRHRKCLWEREEDQPFILSEAVNALRNATGNTLDTLPLSAEHRQLLTNLFREFSA